MFNQVTHKDPSVSLKSHSGSSSKLALDDPNSSLYIKISKTRVARLEKNEELVNNLKHKMKNKKLKMSVLSRRLYGIMMMLNPKLALDSAEIICALAVAAFLNDCGFEVDKIGNCTPSASSLKEVMIKEAVETILLERKDMAGKPLTILCDKGEGESSRDGACFVKLVARYEEERVRVTSIGIQSAGNTSVDGAKGIDRALMLFDTEEDHKQVAAGGSDAGGGATRMDLGVKLNQRGRVRKICEYIATTCTLHGMNLTLQSPTTLTMGEGRLYKCSAMQLLHTAYNLSQQYRVGEWSSLWLKITKKKCKQMKSPVMTRWEYVSEAVENMLDNKNEWEMMAVSIVQVESTGTAKHTIASYLHSLIREQMLVAHLYFLRGYVEVWWDPHFQWHKHVDPETGANGFLAVHMAVRYYVQTHELNELVGNWKEREEFNKFKSQFPREQDDYTMDDLAKNFFNRVEDRFHKHFSQWQDKHLHLMLGGEHEPAMYLARWLLGKSQPTGEATTYTSKKHGRIINLSAMITFLTKNKQPDEVRSKEFFLHHKPAIEELASGEKIRDENASECMKLFFKYVKENFFTVATNTQLVERWVKDSNECFSSGKDKHFASLVGICRSSTVFDYKYIAKQEAEERELRGNRFLTGGKLGERIDRRTNKVETENIKEKINVCGRYFTNLVVKKTKERSKRLDMFEPKKEDKKKIRELLMSKDEQLSTIRTAATMQQYLILNDPNHQDKAENAMQRVTGHDATQHMLGRVQYTKLGTRHLPLVREEIAARGGTYEKKEGIRKLGKTLLALEVIIQKREIREKTGNNEPDDSLINTKTYLPLCQPASEYGLH